jgi:hypothetical protein
MAAGTRIAGSGALPFPPTVTYGGVQRTQRSVPVRTVPDPVGAWYVTHPPGGDAFERLSADAVTALALRKVSHDHRLRLRFCFEVAGLREAVRLANDLRRTARSVVRVHPGRPRASRRRLWIVALTTPPARVGPEAIRRWGAELREVARRHDGCRLVGLRPILAPGGADPAA